MTSVRTKSLTLLEKSGAACRLAAIVAILLFAGVTVLSLLRSPEQPAVEFSVRPRSPVVHQRLEEVSRLLAVQGPKYRTTVTVTKRLPHKGGAALDNCEVFLAVLRTNMKRTPRAIHRAHAIICRVFAIRQPEAWGWLESRVIAIDARDGDAWMWTLGGSWPTQNATELGRFLAANGTTLTTDDDVRELWGVLTSLCLWGGKPGRHFRTGPHSWELLLDDGLPNKCFLRLQTNEHNIVTDARLVSRRTGAERAGDSKGERFGGPGS